MPFLVRHCRLELYIVVSVAVSSGFPYVLVDSSVAVSSGFVSAR